VSIVSQLSGGDRRSIGRSNQIAAQAAKDPKHFAQLIAALWHADPVIRMRAADAAEKASARRPALLPPYKKELLGLLVEATQPELRWHLAQIIPRLDLSPQELQRAASALRTYLADRSSIVRTFAMQALADLAEQDETLRPEIVDLVRRACKTGSPAMRARARKLLRQFENP
jgi:hypothetical protein